MRRKLIKVKYLAPTNTRGARVKITDTFENISRTLPYDYSKNSVTEIAIESICKLNNIPKDKVEVLLSSDKENYLVIDYKYIIKAV